MGARYLGGYIGDDKTKCDWLKECVEKYEWNNCALRKTFDKYPQYSYAAVSPAVQAEWIFLKRVMKDTEQLFTGIEKVLLEKNLPCLFYGKQSILETPFPMRQKHS